ncbi:hypothetical protein TNCV_3824591 [Trichonephila clavipes]|nr:hypothetical protein TNCV_3824591 [Trichonephila clavipes]
MVYSNNEYCSTPVKHGCDEVIGDNLYNTVPLFKECNHCILDSQYVDIADTKPYHQTTYSVIQYTSNFQCWRNTSGVQLETESGLVYKQRVTLIPLHPKLDVQQPTFIVSRDVLLTTNT